jgi:hypothetical protein
VGDIGRVDLSPGEDWIRARCDPVGAIETAHVRPWSTVLRVPLEREVVWFKACAPVQSFEPYLSARLFSRWPDRVGVVLDHDVDRGWLLLADAGTPVAVVGNPPEAWLEALPRYAELQQGEVAFVADYLAHGVPDLRAPTLADHYNALLNLELPLEPDEIARLREFAPTFVDLCRELDGHGIPATVQHDDLHGANLYSSDNGLRVLDWGDASISHPFASLVVTYRFLEKRTGLAPTDPWFARLRDAYLEAWGTGLREAFALAERVGRFAHAIAWARQRRHLPDSYLRHFDVGFAEVLRRALDARSSIRLGRCPREG